jgi:signal transduction histidine kinase
VHSSGHCHAVIYGHVHAIDDDAPTLTRRILEIGAMAAAYFVAGKFALLLAIPPGYATAIWPAAGLALAGMLITRSRVWPGILIGHFFVNLFTSYDAASAATIARSLGLAAAIGVGGALQAWLGASLVARYVGFPTRLDQEKEILRFLLLGGPISCTVGSTIGVATLLAFGEIGWPSVAFHLFTWWVGDSIGVTLVAPVVVLIAAGRHEVPVRRQTAVTVPLVAMLLLAVVFFSVARREIDLLREGALPGWFAMALLVVGLLFTSLMSAFLMLLTGRAAMIERVVAQRTNELEVANRELEAFSYSVAHDLRSPLTEVLGYAEILTDLLEFQLDTKTRRYLDQVVTGAQRMAGLIDDLMKLSKITTASLHPESVDLSEMAEIIIAELRTREPRRQVQAEIAPGITAVCDRGLIKIALENLLGNAWKFTARRPDARISFTVEPFDDRYAFCVTDNGAGFDMNAASRLFTPFTRLHKSTDFDGTGVGLATVQRIITRHEGRISAAAVANEGASFSFTIGDQPIPRTASSIQRKAPSGLVHK